MKGKVGRHAGFASKKERGKFSTTFAERKTELEEGGGGGGRKEKKEKGTTTTRQISLSQISDSDILRLI